MNIDVPTAEMEPSVPGSTLESIDRLPTEAVTAEPTIFDNAGDTVQAWTGTIESLPAGSQFNDLFKSETLATGACGIDGNSEEVNQLITQYRDSGKLISVKGVLFEDVPDVYGCQIRVTALEEE